MGKRKSAAVTAAIPTAAPRLGLFDSVPEQRMDGRLTAEELAGIRGLFSGLGEADQVVVIDRKSEWLELEASTHQGLFRDR